MKKLIVFIIIACCLLTACTRSAKVNVLYNPDLYQATKANIDGNPYGNITIVEFFDYRCSACRLGYGALREFITVDPNVRVVYRELPILGDASIYAARAAIASQLQGRYLAFHNALMTSDVSITDATVMYIARQLHINTTKLGASMQSLYVENQLAQNANFAKDLEIQGTPVYVVAYTPWSDGVMQVKNAKAYMGALSLKNFEDIIAFLQS
jgi:protein-disulfide isomerase